MQSVRLTRGDPLAYFASSPQVLDALAEYGGLVGLSDDLVAASRDPCHPPPPPDLDAQALKALGDAAFKAKDHVRAIGAYTRAVAVARTSAVDDKAKAALFSNRAAASAGLGAHFDAFSDGIAAAALKVDWVKGHVRVANALRKLEHPREAIAAYYHALRLIPGDLDLNTGLCEAVAENQKLHAARSP